jgi:hypothetical protein
MEAKIDIIKIMEMFLEKESIIDNENYLEWYSTAIQDLTWLLWINIIYKK